MKKTIQCKNKIKLYLNSLCQNIYTFMHHFKHSIVDKVLHNQIVLRINSSPNDEILTIQYKKEEKNCYQDFNDEKIEIIKEDDGTTIILLHKKFDEGFSYHIKIQTLNCNKQFKTFSSKIISSVFLFLYNLSFCKDPAHPKFLFSFF